MPPPVSARYRGGCIQTTLLPACLCIAPTEALPNARCIASPTCPMRCCIWCGSSVSRRSNARSAGKPRPFATNRSSWRSVTPLELDLHSRSSDCPLDDKWNRNTIPRHMGRVSWPPESRRHKTSIRGKDIIETCCCSMRVAATERDSSSNVADMKRKKGECIHAQRVTETPAAIPAPADASSLLLRQRS